MFTIKETFVKTGIPENKLYYEVRQGRIKSIQKYGRFLIPDSEVKRLIREEEEKRNENVSGTKVRKEKP